MMYQEYPELSPAQQVELLSDIDFTNCCQLPVSNAVYTENFADVRIESLLNKPVLRARSEDRGLLIYDLTTGARIETIDADMAQAIAIRFAASRYENASPQLLGLIHNDQWTVYGAYNPLRPLYKYTLDDPANTEIYVSSRTGEIIQVTTSSQRVWGYLGAVIHWLYPTILRENTALWSQVVIWLTILGMFLTGTGLYIGIRQYKQRSNGRKSPYRGMALYHHYAGLIFGVLTLTWVSSGLLSMNPWGALEGEGAGLESQRLTQRTVQWQDIEALANQLSTTSIPRAVRLSLSVLNNEPQVVAHLPDGDTIRMHPDTLLPDALTESELSMLADKLQPRSQIRSQEMIHEGDNYYYDHHVALLFPVYRVVINDEQRRHYYLSPVDGQLLRKIDSELRLYRWLFYGLHRGDFSEFFRSRPVWDIFMVLFLCGVTLVCATGSYMALKRVRRNINLFRFKVSDRPVTKHRIKDI